MESYASAWLLVHELLAGPDPDLRARFRDYLASVSRADFARPIDVLENGMNPLQECIYTVLEEQFWHNRYAGRDLTQLEAAT